MSPDSALMVSSSLLLGLKELEEDRNWDLSCLLAEHGLERDLLGKSDGSVPLFSFIQFLQECAAQYNFPGLGLEIARRRPALEFGVLTYLLKVSPTVKYALSHGNSYARLLNPGREWVAEYIGESVIITRVDRSGYKSTMDQYLALSIAQYYKLVEYFVGRDWQAEEIFFTFGENGQRQLYEEYFGTHIQFDAESNSIRFPSKFMDREISTYDARLLAIVESHIEALAKAQPRTVAEAVDFNIRVMIASPQCDLKAVAGRLRMHDKAMQRQLQLEGTSFRELLLKARMDYATSYLENTDLHVNQIAELIGYSCGPALSRSFKQQFGESPDSWRRRHV